MKNKGFTMIELLATITILGIITVIGVSAVNGLIQKGRENYYRTQKNNLISAAKSYYQANKSALPKSRGEKGKVTYGQLKEGKFIGKMYAADKKTECNLVNTFVEVTKIKNSKYKYTSYLSCKEKNEAPSSETSGTFTAVLNPHPNATNTDIYYDITVNGSVNAKHYSYTVTKNGFHYTGPIEDNVNSKTFTTKKFTIDKNSNNPLENVFMVIIKITDANGKTHTITKEAKIGDTKDPICTYDGNPNALPAWSKNAQTIKMKCTDPTEGNFASGCEKDIYKVIIKNQSDIDKYKDGFTIKDKAGRTATCDIKKYIRLDFEPPSCPVATGYEKTSATDISTPGSLSTKPTKTWSKKWILTTASGSVDRAAGIANNGIGGVYYKVTTRGKTENVTGLKQSYRNVDAEGESTVTYQACDALDNCTTNCGESNNSEYVTKLDRTAPKIKVEAFKCDSNDEKTGPVIKTYNAATSLTINSSAMPNAHNEWLNKANYANGICFTTTYTDESAIAKREWKYNAKDKKLTDTYQVFDNSESPKRKTSYNTTDKSSYTTSESYNNRLNAQGVRYGEFIVQDAAGNEAKATFTMKIDKVAPIISTKIYACNSAYNADTTKEKGSIATTAGDPVKTIKTGSLTDHQGDKYWLNKQYYPYGTCMVSNVTDNNALYSKYWGWNRTKYKYEESGYTTLNGTGTTNSPSTATYGITNPNSFVTSNTYTHRFKTQGHRYGVLEMTDIAGNKSSITYSFKQDNVDPSVTITAGTTDNYTLKATAKSDVSKIDKVHWDSNDYTNINNEYEHESTQNKITTTGTRSYTAMDAAGNVSTATHAAYTACDTVVNLGNGFPTKKEVEDANGHVLDLYPKAALTYKWTHDSSKDQCWENANNDYNRPKRAYKFEEYGCKCKVDKYNDKYCSYVGYVDYTYETHTGGYAYVYYNNSDNGVKSCQNAQKDERNKTHYVNTYVYQVCRDGTEFSQKVDDPNTNERTLLNYHGYRWYSGTGDNDQTKYHAFDHDYWTHTGHSHGITYNERIPKSKPITNNDVCIHACKATYGTNR